MKHKFNYQQFDIGDWVKVRRRIHMISNHKERKNISLPGSPRPFFGRISGVKIFREGKIIWDRDNWDYDACGRYVFAHENTITCWEIRIGLLNKPIYALPEDIEFCTVQEMESLELPIIKGDFKSSWEGPTTERLKKNLSDDSKTWPRDEKGRWTSDPIIHKC